MVPWEIQAREFVACNCDYGCPCQFNALPTYGNCEAIAGFEITKGHFGDTRLDGLNAVSIFWWPGPIHERGGKGLLIVDERADEAQRQALLTILSGGETEAGATMWAVFATTMEKMFDPVFAAIDINVDIEAREGRIFIEGIAECTGQPIRNPVTGDVHRVRIDLPHGFEYTLAEIGASTFSTQGPIALDNEDRYAQFANIHLSNHGIVREAVA